MARTQPTASVCEWRRFAIVVLVLHYLVCLLPTRAGAGEGGPGLPLAEHRRAFLVALEGPWEGQARVTPVGPRPYDIVFVRTAPQQVEGQAHPGASTHYWSFYEEDETLKLRFLSTFADNQQPLFLTATTEQDGALVFRPPPPDSLEVHVQPQATALTLKIFLRGKPHVEIHLTRRS